MQCLRVSVFGVERGTLKRRLACRTDAMRRKMREMNRRRFEKVSKLSTSFNGVSSTTFSCVLLPMNYWYVVSEFWE